MIYKNFEIRFATKDDIDDIMEFIRKEWSEKHILANEKDFFIYESANKDETINFDIVVDLSQNEIVAIHAFYKYGESPDYFGGLWKAKKTPIPLLGVMLKRFLYENISYRSFSSVGSNPDTTIPIQKTFNYHVGKLHHFYLLQRKEAYQVAKIDIAKYGFINTSIKQYEIFPIYSFEQLNRFDFKKNFDIRPFKDPVYIQKRYFNHPIYTYKVWQLMTENQFIDSLLIGREIQCNGVKVLRLIDFIGREEGLSHLGQAFKTLQDREGYEYIDFYCHGISAHCLLDSGFVLRDEIDGNIIPNYFEPFVQKNVEIYYHTTEEKNIRICKGDSDQDRPSLMIKN